MAYKLSFKVVGEVAQTRIFKNSQEVQDFTGELAKNPDGKVEWIGAAVLVDD